jgi:ElaB/YqjD/DUF883 family membrane-anchored ribosome-binding protein
MSARNVEQEFDNLKADFGKLSADLSALSAALRDLTGQDAQDYLAKLRSVAEARGQDAMASVGRHISQRPLASLLICFGLGFIIAKLIDR